MSNNAMSNETDLDWLARNVHEWPAGDHQPWCYVYWKGGHRAVSANCITFIHPCVRIEKAEWLARRAELQNKPAKWPIGANWLAQDKDGEWWFYTDEIDNPPQNHGEDNWYSDDVAVRCRLIGEVIGDWRDTLEKRPEQDEFEPLVSVEDSQEKDMTQQQDSGWFERGELPPIGIAVQLWHGGTYAYDCELIAKRGNDFVLWNLTWDRPDSADCMMCEFKPIPTERDKLVELIKTYRHTFRSDTEFADAILAAGFKRGAA